MFHIPVEIWKELCPTLQVFHWPHGTSAKPHIMRTCCSELTSTVCPLCALMCWMWDFVFRPVGGLLLQRLGADRQWQGFVRAVRGLLQHVHRLSCVCSFPHVKLKMQPCLFVRSDVGFGSVRHTVTTQWNLTRSLPSSLEWVELKSCQPCPLLPF